MRPREALPRLPCVGVLLVAGFPEASLLAQGPVEVKATEEACAVSTFPGDELVPWQDVGLGGVDGWAVGVPVVAIS